MRGTEVHSVSCLRAVLIFLVSAPVECRDLIVLRFHQDINTIMLRGSDENGMANIPDTLVSEPVHGDKFYKDLGCRH